MYSQCYSSFFRLTTWQMVFSIALFCASNVQLVLFLFLSSHNLVDGLLYLIVLCLQCTVSAIPLSFVSQPGRWSSLYHCSVPPMYSQCYSSFFRLTTWQMVFSISLFCASNVQLVLFLFLSSHNLVDGLLYRIVLCLQCTVSAIPLSFVSQPGRWSSLSHCSVPPMYSQCYSSFFRLTTWQMVFSIALFCASNVQLVLFLFLSSHNLVDGLLYRIVLCLQCTVSAIPLSFVSQPGRWSSLSHCSVPPMYSQCYSSFFRLTTWQMVFSIALFCASNVQLVLFLFLSSHNLVDGLLYLIVLCLQCTVSAIPLSFISQPGRWSSLSHCSVPPMYSQCYSSFFRLTTWQMVFSISLFCASNVQLVLFLFLSSHNLVDGLLYLIVLCLQCTVSAIPLSFVSQPGRWSSLSHCSVPLMYSQCYSSFFRLTTWQMVFSISLFCASNVQLVLFLFLSSHNLVDGLLYLIVLCLQCTVSAIPLSFVSQPQMVFSIASVPTNVQLVPGRWSSLSHCSVPPMYSQCYSSFFRLTTWQMVFSISLFCASNVQLVLFLFLSSHNLVDGLLYLIVLCLQCTVSAIPLSFVSQPGRWSSLSHCSVPPMYSQCYSSFFRLTTWQMVFSISLFCASNVQLVLFLFLSSHNLVDGLLYLIVLCLQCTVSAIPLSFVSQPGRWSSLSHCSVPPMYSQCYSSFFRLTTWQMVFSISLFCASNVQLVLFLFLSSHNLVDGLLYRIVLCLQCTVSAIPLSFVSQPGRWSSLSHCSVPPMYSQCYSSFFRLTTWQMVFSISLFCASNVQLVLFLFLSSHNLVDGLLYLIVLCLQCTVSAIPLSFVSQPGRWSSLSHCSVPPMYSQCYSSFFRLTTWQMVFSISLFCASNVQLVLFLFLSSHNLVDGLLYLIVLCLQCTVSAIPLSFVLQPGR